MTLAVCELHESAIYAPLADYYHFLPGVPGIFPGMDLPVQKLDAFPRVALVKGCPGPKAYALVTLSQER